MLNVFGSSLLLFFDFLLMDAAMRSLTFWIFSFQFHLNEVLLIALQYLPSQALTHIHTHILVCS